MNILAHCLLSGSNAEVLFGNFIADGLSRKQWETLPEQVQVGIQLHHFIDSFTDKHPIVLELVQLLRPTQGKYSPVVSDILFDHLLSRDWNKYSQQNLKDYVDWVHAELERQKELMVPSRQRMFGFMMEYQWLLGYPTEKGIRNVLQGMQRRSQFESHMASAYDDFLRHEEKWQKGFDEFFPELQEESRKVYQKLANA